MPPVDVPSSALVIAAHPDDVDFGAAGTVATWVAAGASVTYCVVTDGDAGGFDPLVPRDQIPAIRRAEQEAAAAVVGVRDVRFLGYPDGYLEATLDLRRALARVIREVRPQVVLSQSPERHYARIYASHPDHRAAGEAAFCAVYPDSRNPFAFPELLADGLEAHVVEEIWMMADPSPDRAVDVTDCFELKVEALRAHVSQTAHHEDLPGMLRGWLGDQARRFGLGEGRLAEVFRVVDAR